MYKFITGNEKKEVKELFIELDKVLDTEMLDERNIIRAKLQ